MSETPELPQRPIRYLKLSSGEDLISEVELHPEHNGVITLMNPFRVLYLYAEGALMPQFHPIVYGNYFVTTHISANDLVMLVDPGEPMAVLYRDFIKHLKTDFRPRGAVLH